MTEPTQFFDINQLPQDEGILLFGISMSRIGNAQSAEKCLGHIKHLGEKIGKTEGIGAVFLYGDYLYLHSDEPASKLRDRYKELMLSHKGAFLKALFKDDKAWVKKAFSFYTFGQVMLDNAEDYTTALKVVTKMYESNQIFKDAVHRDCERAGKEITNQGVIFILEEITLFYLSAKGKIEFNNKFVSGTEKWVLQCYPGRPLESEILLFQNNPLKIENEDNKFENCFYDLENKKLYDYTKIDINNFDFK